MSIKKVWEKIEEIGTAPRQYYLFGALAVVFLLDGLILALFGKDDIGKALGGVMIFGGIGWTVSFYYFYQYRKLQKKEKNVP